MSIHKNDNLQELLAKNKVADSYQYYKNCNMLIGQLRYQYETLNKIILRDEVVSNSIHEKISLDWTSDEVKEFCNDESNKNYRMSINGEKANIEYEIQGRFMLILGMMQSLLDSYAKWINTSLLARKGYSKKDCNIYHLCCKIDGLGDSLYFCKGFLESNVLQIQKSEEFLYINNLNNIIKHQSIIRIKSYVSSDGTWHKGIPKFKKQAKNSDYVYEAKDMLTMLERCLNCFCEAVFASVEFIRDFYKTNENPFTADRTHEVGLFKAVDGSKVCREYFFIPESEVNKKGKNYLLIEDGNYHVHNCYMKEVMVTEDGDPEKIVGKLVVRKDNDIRLQYKEVTEKQTEILDMKLNDFEIRYIPFEWSGNTEPSSDYLGSTSLNIKHVIYKHL